MLDQRKLLTFLRFYPLPYSTFRKIELFHIPLKIEIISHIAFPILVTVSSVYASSSFCFFLYKVTKSIVFFPLCDFISLSYYDSLEYRGVFRLTLLPSVLLTLS